MKYETLHEDLEEAFPELKPCIEILKSEWAPDLPGQYIFYEDLFGRFIVRLLVADPSHNRNVALDRAFRHIDELLLDGEVEIGNLGFVAMLEGHPGWWYARAKSFLSDKAEAALYAWWPDWSKHIDPTVVELDLSYDPYRLQQVVDSLLSAPSAKPPKKALR